MNKDHPKRKHKNEEAVDPKRSQKEAGKFHAGTGEKDSRFRKAPCLNTPYEDLIEAIAAQSAAIRAS